MGNTGRLFCSAPLKRLDALKVDETFISAGDIPDIKSVLNQCTGGIIGALSYGAIGEYLSVFG